MSKEPSMKLNKIFGVLYVIMGAVLAAGPWTFARICSGATMKGEVLCRDMRADATILGLLLLIMGILFFLIGQKLIDILFSTAVTAGGVCAILIPTVWARGCAKKGMLCHDQTMPFLLLMGALMILSGLFAIYLFAPKKKSDGAAAKKDKKAKAAEEPPKTTKEKVEEAADAEAEVVEAVEAEIVEDGTDAVEEAAEDVEIVAEAEDVVVEDKA